MIAEPGGMRLRPAGSHCWLGTAGKGATELETVIEDGTGTMNEVESDNHSRSEGQQDSFQLRPHEIGQIESALGSACPFGHVRLIVREGQLRQIIVTEKLYTRKVDRTSSRQ